MKTKAWMKYSAFGFTFHFRNINFIYSELLKMFVNFGVEEPPVIELPPRSELDNTKNSDTDLSKDRYKRSGQILFRLTEFKAFLEADVPYEEYSDPVEYINGMPWRIWVGFDGGYLAFYLSCEGDSNDMAWSCQTDYQLSIVSSTKNDEFLMEKSKQVFTAQNSRGPGTYVKFEHLMDPKNGIYDEEGDTVTFKAQITAEKPRGMAGVRTVDPLLINGKVVYVNKLNLSMHSEFFHNLFFGGMAEQSPKVQIDGIENAMENFERLIATMYPQNLELDDDCVENVLHLANRFLLDSVENLCVNFLMNKSQKSAIFKFRLAHQYGIIGMKDKILSAMTKEDFAIAGENCIEFLLERNKLDAETVQELSERHKKLFE